MSRVEKRRAWRSRSEWLLRGGFRHPVSASISTLTTSPPFAWFSVEITPTYAKLRFRTSKRSKP